MTSDDSAIRREALARAAYLVGVWTGHGVVHSGSASTPFVQTETVTIQLDGELVSVTGVGHDPIELDRQTHLAFAVLSYDTEQERYEWRAYSRGDWTTTELELDPNGFRWSLEVSPGWTIRYTATVVDDVWDEVGESRQGTDSWSTVLSMRLHRQDPLSTAGRSTSS